MLDVPEAVCYALLAEATGLELVDLTTVYDDQDVIHTEVQVVKNQIIVGVSGGWASAEAGPRARPGTPG